MGPGEGDTTTEAVDPARIRRVIEAYPVRLAVMFGSQANGTASEESDVDIAVAFDEELSPSQRLRKRIELTTELVTSLGTDAVDIADLETIRPEVGAAALTDGTVLVGDRSTVDTYRKRFARERADDDTHSDRMEQFDAILERLDAKV